MGFPYFAPIFEESLHKAPVNYPDWVSQLFLPAVCYDSCRGMKDTEE
jgi:hypothetical protein